ncbi:RNA methyltransferase [Fusobacterium russii]|uniref:RNA methyltransferase n=1 Tax=Fusobacterium russii TaxID=854 RepID=UPI00039CD139|nr:RNA methyltransferase [Fusobacterium russii]
MRNKVYLSLVHYPVYNRNRDIVCTSVTNFDIHDISRSCGTYELKGYRLVVPVEAQKKLTERIINYWQDGTGGQYNKDREKAFGSTEVVESIEDVIKEIEEIEGQKPVIITTSARLFPNTITYKDLSKNIFEDEKPYLLLFGTGWGLTDEVMDMSDYILEPIRANCKYNHLSVRAAVAIILDRLFGEN